mmetsp:Transcript_27759/g.89089  ORF Transcript_27759/g.89089 Transcript_27759/m.89089 type:complete len:425 (+) Transcript_27759:390-1664(+)
MAAVAHSSRACPCSTRPCQIVGDHAIRAPLRPEAASERRRKHQPAAAAPCQRHLFAAAPASAAAAALACEDRRLEPRVVGRDEDGRAAGGGEASHHADGAVNGHAPVGGGHGAGPKGGASGAVAWAGEGRGGCRVRRALESAGQISATNAQPRTVNLGRISRPHLSATSLGHIWAASRTEAEVDALEGRVTKELPPPRLHRRRKPGRRSEECAQQAAEGRRCGAALSGREDGPRRRSAAGRAGRAIAFFFGGEGGVEPDCAHPRSVANHAHPSGGGHRVGAHRPAGREEEPPLSPLRLLLAPPLSRVPLECVSRRPEWGREWPRGRLWRLTRPTGGPSARQAPPPEARKARGVCGRVHVEGDIDPSHYSGSGASARVIRQSMAVPPLRPAPRPAGALLAPSSGGGEKKRERSCGEAQSTSSTRR